MGENQEFSFKTNSGTRNRCLVHKRIVEIGCDMQSHRIDDNPEAPNDDENEKDGHENERKG